MKLSVIIPAYNRHDLSAACLDSLARSSGPELGEVIFVDNASSDATPERIPPLGESFFGSRFRYLRLPDNRNFAGACNAGARNAHQPLLFLLNNDTLLTPGWSAPLLRAMANTPRIGAASPLLLYPGDLRVQHLGISVAPEGLNHLYRFFPGTHPLVRKKRTWQALSGAALLIPAGLFADAGGFHEGYRNGFEDLELCCRIRQQGYLLSCEPESVVLHLEGQTPGRKDAEAANALLFRERCAGRLSPDIFELVTNDGYELTLTPWLDCLPALSVMKARAISQEAGASPARWHEAVQKEPLWAEGYARLAGGLEQRGNWEAATRMRLYQAVFAPTAASLMLLGKAAARAGNADLARQSFDQATRIRALTTKTQQRAQRARELRDALPYGHPMRSLYAKYAD